MGSLVYTPFALVSTLYATVLIFDDLIAYFLLGKLFNFLEIAGIVVIMSSLGLSASFSPDIAYDVFPESHHAPAYNTSHAIATVSSVAWAAPTILTEWCLVTENTLCNARAEIQDGNLPDHILHNITNTTAPNPFLVVQEGMYTPGAAIVLSLLAVIIIGGWLMVRKFEKKYPTFPQDVDVVVPQYEYRIMQIVYPAILVRII